MDNVLVKKEELLNILESIRPDIDFHTAHGMIDDGILDSFDIISIVSEIDETFNIYINVADLVPENFNTLEGICKLVEKYKE